MGLFELHEAASEEFLISVGCCNELATSYIIPTGGSSWDHVDFEEF